MVIGPRWLDASYSWGRHRLDDPADFVRVEIETALRQGVPVIPLLVGGASMPPSRRLPERLRPLLRQNGPAVRRDPDFSRDMERVFSAIEYWQAQPRPAAEPTEPTSVAPPTAPVELPQSQPLSDTMRATTRQATDPALAEQATHPALAPASSPIARVAVAARPRPRQRNARLPLLLSALAVVLVAGLVLAPSLLPLLSGRADVFLTPAQKTGIAYSGTATRTAQTGATAEARAQQTVNALSTIAAGAKAITLGYTSAHPGCDIDTTYWVPPLATNVNCSATGATLSGYGDENSGVGAQVNESPEDYTVRVTVSHLQGGCAIQLKGANGTMIISLDAQPTAARWTIIASNVKYAETTGTMPLSSSYTLVMQQISGIDYASPNDLTLSINGTLVQGTGRINPQPSGEFAIYSPG